MRSGGRRRVAALLVMGVLGLSGCGEKESADFAAETPTPTETPTYVPPTYVPPKLDNTQLAANMAKLSAADKALIDHYLSDALGEGTWIVAAPMTVDEAKERLLGPNPRRATEADEQAMTNANISAYSFVQVGDGVVAYEDTGFADPPKRLLAALSRDGAISAVATDNIEAMTRFGYARDGKIVFDAFEYAFVESLEEIPAEVRDLAALAWEDLEGPLVESADWSSVAMAMSEKVTGVRPTRAVWKVEDWYVVPLPWGAMEDG